jgi:hypothetical protein
MTGPDETAGATAGSCRHPIPMAKTSIVGGYAPASPLRSPRAGSLLCRQDLVQLHHWVDAVTVGTIMRVPKTGGGMATIIARDTTPYAITVDKNAVYWSDVGGNIMRLPK